MTLFKKAAVVAATVPLLPSSFPPCLIRSPCESGRPVAAPAAKWPKR
jgi:hypothetical protein